MKTILVKDGAVVNIIKSTDEHNANITSEYDHIEKVQDDTNINIGATWDGENYTNPEPDPLLVNG